MFEKLSVSCILVWSLILGGFVVDANAANPNLIGTWKATLTKISPSGCSNEVVTLRILRQSGNLIGGDLNIAGYTTNCVGRVSSYTPGQVTFYFYGWQSVGSSTLNVNLSASYDSANPDQITVPPYYSQGISAYLSGNETMCNTWYDCSAPFLRQ